MIRYCTSLDEQQNLIMTKDIPMNEIYKIIIMNNIIENLLYDKTYFFSKNFFEINFIEIDNMSNKDLIRFKIESLFQKNLKYGKIYPEYVIYDDLFNFEDGSHENNSNNKIENDKTKFEYNNKLNENDNSEISEKSLNKSILAMETVSNKKKLMQNDLDYEDEDEREEEQINISRPKYNLRMVLLHLNSIQFNIIFILFLIK